MGFLPENLKAILITPGKICKLNKKSPPPSRGGLAALKLMVAQVFNLCTGGVLLFL